jgi:hypothetical protein
MLDVRQKMNEGLARLDDEQLALVQTFIDQILLCHDPDVVSAFLAWRCDARIGSILDLAAALGDEGRDQLLFAAEELYSDTHMPQVTTYRA